MSNPWMTPLPTVQHQLLTPSELKSRTIVVGDVHGCLEELKELLSVANYSPADSSLVFVGDLVNKGPFSAEVVQFVRSLNAFCVRGNHDETLISHMLETDHKNIFNGCDYIEKLTSDDIAWLQNLPYTISMPIYNALVVHAGLVPGVTLDRQTPLDMCTMRNLIKVAETSNNVNKSSEPTISWSASSGVDKGQPWAGMWGTNREQCALTCSGNNRAIPQHILFGHDAKRGLQQYEYATGLDTGCVYGKKLSAVVLPSHELIQVDAKQVYETPKSN